MNHHVPQPEVKVIDGRGLLLAVGSKTPYPLFDGATLSIGPSGLAMVVSLPNPAKPEIRALKRGAIDVGLMLSDGSAIALWRFADKTSPVVLETPFHIGLLPPGDRWIPAMTELGGTHPVLIIVQDEQRICRAVRLFPLPVNFSRTIERVVVKQARDAARPGWTRAVHDRDVDQYFETYRDPGEAMKACEQGAILGGRNPIPANPN